jgi:hypothetical protein
MSFHTIFHECDKIIKCQLKTPESLVSGANACNPKHFGGRDQEDRGSRSVWRGSGGWQGVCGGVGICKTLSQMGKSWAWCHIPIILATGKYKLVDSMFQAGLGKPASKITRAKKG